MAERAATQVTTQEGVVVITWAGVLNGDTGSWVNPGGYFNKCAQITGTTGAGFSCTMQGSNDGAVTAGTLHDASGGSSSLTSLGFTTMVEQPLLIRPIVGNGDGDTSLTIIMTMMSRVN